MLILSQDDLKAVLTMRDVIAAIENGFRAMAAGNVRVPERLMLDIHEANGTLLEMPSYIIAPPALGTKIVTVFPANKERGLEAIQSMYLLLDPETGVPVSLMDGMFLTAIRTSATSAVATKLMAASNRKRLAIFGAGVQAEFHVAAMNEVVEVASVSISSRDEARAKALADRIRLVHNLQCEVLRADEALSSSNLICTCTTAATPIFEGMKIRPGSHINAVGSFTPTTRELDTEAVRRARVIIDAKSAAGREAGDILIPMAEGAIDASHVKGTLADLVSGKVAGRQSEEEVTIFKSCGLAIEDLVTAQLAYTRAVEAKLGAKIE